MQGTPFDFKSPKILRRKRCCPSPEFKFGEFHGPHIAMVAWAWLSSSKSSLKIGKTSKIYLYSLHTFKLPELNYVDFVGSLSIHLTNPRPINFDFGTCVVIGVSGHVQSLHLWLWISALKAPPALWVFLLEFSRQNIEWLTLGVIQGSPNPGIELKVPCTCTGR